MTRKRPVQVLMLFISSLLASRSLWSEIYSRVHMS